MAKVQEERDKYLNTLEQTKRHLKNTQDYLNKMAAKKEEWHKDEMTKL